MRRVRLGVAVLTLTAASMPGPPALAAASHPDVWAQRYNGSANHGDTERDIALSPDGSLIFVTGGSAETGTHKDITTIAYDSRTGEQVWMHSYDGPDHRRDIGNAVTVSPDGSALYVTGASLSSPKRSANVTLAFDSVTGAELWISRLQGGYRNGPHTIDTSPDGRQVFVAGISDDRSRHAAVAYDAATGEELWLASYHRRYSTATAISASPDGSSVVVTGGTSSAESGHPMVTVAYDAATGEAKWINKLSPAWAEDVAFSPDSNVVYVAGGIDAGDNGDMVILAIDVEAGTKLWQRRYVGSNGRGDGASAITVSPDGASVFVTGTTLAAPGSWFDYATVALNSDGSVLWSRRYNGPSSGYDFGTAIATSPDGARVFVTGTSQDFGSSGDEDDRDWATLAYDAAVGTRLWTARYDGSADYQNIIHDHAASIVVSPDGMHVFVGGSSVGIDSGDDYATVAYATE